MTVSSVETPGETTPQGVAADVGEFFGRVFSQLDGWRDRVSDGSSIGPGTPDGLEGPDGFDGLVESLVVPELGRPDPLFIGAGYIGAGYIGAGSPKPEPDPAATNDVHFSWWLGPQSGNPVIARTLAPTRLDLATRVHIEYLRDFRSLEWYSIPSSTRRTHVTGPYVDQLCTFEYILTITVPVLRQADGRMVGVVGVDVAVRTLEDRLLRRFIDCRSPLALLSHSGRVILSTDAAVLPGSLLGPATGDRIACPATPFTLATL